MSDKTIAIIGSGMGGLAAGIYGRLNGYQTHIFEMHAVPGGQCTAWKRKGYTFDACIHHLFGCGPDSSFYSRWEDLGAALFAGSMERRYLDLGGSIHYRARVATILAENGRAVGVKLADGSEHRADVVISNADGRRTIHELLEGRFIDERTRTECQPANDEMPFAVQVFLGVNRDLSREPSSMVVLLDEPVTLANHACRELEVQLYGFDPTMAPAGKGIIKVELHSQYSWWKGLAADREHYAETKQELADRVVDLLERCHFTGLRQQVEVIDVATPLTWERFTGGTMGLGIYPHRKFSPFGSATGNRRTMTLPGLSNFYFAGTWATNAGALFLNALSGKRVVQAVCRGDARRFISR